MTQRSKVSVVAGCAAALFLAGSVLALNAVSALRGREATLEDIAYIPSGKALKRFSLGYSSLLADIYWTRAVQYFGARHLQHSMHYDLLDPLLDVTTDLDPHLTVAYEFGSVFLSQKPPNGAGQPDKAVALVEKGIRQNPEYWRLYFTLGFIHYMDRHDFKAAQQAFEKGSEIPGALPWMKVMAARMAERSEDITTAVELWKALYETTADKQLRKTAEEHLISLKAQMDMAELSKRVQIYREQTGRLPASWTDLIREHLLRGIPTDPFREPYLLSEDGQVGVKDPEKFPFLNDKVGP